MTGIVEIQDSANSFRNAAGHLLIGLMKSKSVFGDKVFLPLWPLPPLILGSWLATPRMHVFWWSLAMEISCAGWFLVAVRYLWATRSGVPLSDWIVWMLLALTMP